MRRLGAPGGGKRQGPLDRRLWVGVSTQLQGLRVVLPPPLCLCPPRKKFQKKGASQSFSKAARLKWQSLERRIVDIVMQRMAIANLEADMERLIKVPAPPRPRPALSFPPAPPPLGPGSSLRPPPSPQKREELSLLQEALRRKRERLQAESPEEEKGLQELAEEIEVLAANIDYINDSIGDCQATIVQLEETKVPVGGAAGGRRGPGAAALVTWALRLPVQEELDSTDTSVVISSCSLAEARLLLDNFLKASIDKVGRRRAAPGPTLEAKHTAPGRAPGSVPHRRQRAPRLQSGVTACCARGFNEMTGPEA